MLLSLNTGCEEWRKQEKIKSRDVLPINQWRKAWKDYLLLFNNNNDSCSTFGEISCLRVSTPLHKLTKSKNFKKKKEKTTKDKHNLDGKLDNKLKNFFKTSWVEYKERCLQTKQIKRNKLNSLIICVIKSNQRKIVKFFRFHQSYLLF